MKRTAWFLILIGVVMKIRGLVVLLGGIEVAQSAKLPAQSPEEMITNQTILLGHALQQGAASLEWSGLLIGAGIVILVGRWLWRLAAGNVGGIQAMELRQRRFSRRR